MRDPSLGRESILDMVAMLAANCLAEYEDEEIDINDRILLVQLGCDLRRVEKVHRAQLERHSRHGGGSPSGPVERRRAGPEGLIL